MARPGLPPPPRFRAPLLPRDFDEEDARALLGPLLRRAAPALLRLEARRLDEDFALDFEDLRPELETLDREGFEDLLSRVVERDSERRVDRFAEDFDAVRRSLETRIA